MHSEFYKYFHDGSELMQRGLFTEAIVAFEKSIAAEPLGFTLELLGECLVQVERLREAVIPLAAATSLNNERVQAPSLLAEVLCQLHRRNEAIDMALCALARDLYDQRANRVLNHYAESGARYYPVPSRAGSQRFTITFPAAEVTVRLHMTPLGDHLFRLEQSPPPRVEVSATDVIQAQTGADGWLVFEKLAVESTFRDQEYFLQPQDIESSHLRTVLDEVERQGGYWEFANPVCLFIRLPQDCGYDPSSEIYRLPSTHTKAT